MSYGSNGLTFNTLRAANIERQKAVPKFNHPKWALSTWSNALFGECGEAANIIKKIERGDFTLEEGRTALAKELADVQVYLDILADKAGIDLGEATRDKWNEVSLREDCNMYISADGRHQYVDFKAAQQRHLKEKR